jgi:hypothetical protein
MFAVDEKTLLSDYGKSCVHQYKDTSDAQSVYCDIFEYMEKSTKASLDSSALILYITSARLGNGTWKGPTHSFILHWQNQIRLYEQLIPHTEYFGSELKRTMLRKEVYPIEELRAVKGQSEQYNTQTGTMLTYEQYVSLLLSAATGYDAQFVATRKSGCRVETSSPSYQYQYNNPTIVQSTHEPPVISIIICPRTSSQQHSRMTEQTQ